ncbi:restriction endonuclease subunit S [Staphylococcus argenteus]|uniref:restriction endonuclease subunit S n=1 Tax=Staphylococcus argenteus TaxID=985002 RepID=UPI001FBBF511|nr:restriction endonuclease subunit S [Staphylococcus argenteus]GJF58426.1 restriction endonuclease subunit S [Staphylococcus argenteus]
MSNENRNVPELRFPGFEEEWKNFAFKDQIISIEKGTDLLGSEENTGVPLIKMGNIKRGYFSFNKLEKLKNGETIQKKYYINKGDFLFNTRNTMELVGKSATWTNESGKFVFNSNIARIVLKGIDTYFFNYLYNTSKMINKVKSLAVGTTSVAAIYPRDLNHLNYFLPSISEQKKIGCFFSKLDRQIELEEQKLSLLEEQKKGYMQKIFSQELRFKDANGNDYPDWKKEKLDNILEFESERTKVENEYPVLTSSRNGLILQSEYYKEGKTFADSNIGYFIIPKGYITYRSRSDDGKFQFNLNNIIDVGIVSKYYPVFRGINMNQSFLTMLMNHQLKKEYIKFATGTSQLVLSQRNLREISTELPITEEQEKIGNFFDKQNSLIEKQSNKVELLKERKKGFLQKMFV